MDGGRGDYPRARRLLITADAGGSNGYRTRAWKAELAALAAAETGLEITGSDPVGSTWAAIGEDADGGQVGASTGRPRLVAVAFDGAVEHE